MIGLLAMAAAVTSDAAVMAKARECGFRPDQIEWMTDTRGNRHPIIYPHNGQDDVPFRVFGCLLDWAQQNHIDVGFMAEPPAQTK